MSEFECACEEALRDPDDFDTPDICEEKRQKSRKSRICEECQGEIEKGEYYMRLTMLCHGEWEHHIFCDHCYGLAQEIQSDTGYIVPIGELACAYLEWMKGKIE